MLFTFGQVSGDMARIINKWIDAYEEIAPAINLYFSTKIGAHKFLEGKFLALVQGLETYHRRTTDEKLMEENDFKKLVESIIKNCPDENREWLQGRLQHGNEVSLSHRLKSIIEPFKESIGNNSERKKLIRHIVDTRNYLTHFDHSLEKKALSGIELWTLCLKLEAIYQLHFLKVLGFTQDEIISVLTNSEGIRQKLKRT